MPLISFEDRSISANLCCLCTEVRIDNEGFSITKVSYLGRPDPSLSEKLCNNLRIGKLRFGLRSVGWVDSALSPGDRGGGHFTEADLCRLNENEFSAWNGALSMESLGAYRDRSAPHKATGLNLSDIAFTVTRWPQRISNAESVMIGLVRAAPGFRRELEAPLRETEVWQLGPILEQEDKLASRLDITGPLVSEAFKNV